MIDIQDLFSLPVLVFTLLGILIVPGWIRLWKMHKLWSDQGVKGPLIIPFFGPLIRVYFRDRLELDMENLRRYGKIHTEPTLSGEPRLVIADPEVIKQILIKDFDAFTDHQMNPFANKFQKKFLVWIQGDYWKRVRSIMSPSFTSGRIKRMFKFLQVCADDLIANIQDHIASGKDIINLVEIYGLYTMDGISTCGYGIKLRRAKEGSNDRSSREEFVRQSSPVFRINIGRVLALAIVPEYLLKLFGYTFASESSFFEFSKRVDDIIKHRKSNPKSTGKHDDLLQMLLDGNLDDKLELTDLDQAENHHAQLTEDSLIADQKKLVESVDKTNDSNKRESKLSDFDVLCEAIFILVAGMDTTRNLLANASYFLAFHPEVQDKLYQELKRISQVDEKGEHIFEYGSLTSCEYLDAVISESLRRYPPATRTDRVASRDYYIEKYNLKIPKGSQILFSIHSVQNSEEYWDEPDKFNPDRFMPGNKEKIVTGTYLPFSLGPRHCIGMRFSLTEAKIGLAKVLMKFKLEPAPGTKYPPRPKASIQLNTMRNPIAKVTLR